MNQPYDLLIIGAGSAGLTAADFAIHLDARVALVEKHRPGGDCTWTGCVPSKALLKAAKVAHHMRTADCYGLKAVEPQVDFKAVMAHVRDIIDDVYHEESPDALRARGIDVFEEAAHFLDPHTVAIGETALKARHVLAATGAHPITPPIEGLENTHYLTYQTVWGLEVLPPRLLVVGGGPVGCEMAQAFRRLGSQVTLVASRDRLLPRDDEEGSRALENVFATEGIDVHHSARARRAWQDGDGIHVIAGDEELVGDALLIATGRRPSIDDLDLEKAGVAYTARGIQVDDHLRTSQRHIYAAGDCAVGAHGDSYQFTHYAGWQAAIAVRNALLPGASKGTAAHVPWTTFTDPEVAHAGLTEAQAREQFGGRVMVCHWPMTRVDRARTEGDTEGFVKLVHKEDGTLLGATVVAERAGETIQEWIVALAHGSKVGNLTGIIHVYPTYSSANLQAAATARMNQMLTSPPGRIIKRLARLLK